MKPLLVLLLMAVVTQCWAIQQQIDYQGYLTRTDGASLDSTVSVAFALYDEVSGGSSLWGETHPGVIVASGLFHVNLGSIIPIPDSLFRLDTLWLGITVGSDAEMQPRRLFASVPFAHRAAFWDSLTQENAADIISRLSSLPDADGDGHIKFSMGGDDCDDLNPLVYTGAPEVCNFRDDNCNGQVDEGLSHNWYPDNDGDGWGVFDSSLVTSCLPIPGYANQYGDCDDNDPNRNPGMTEVCNGIDEDCSGVPDDNTPGCVLYWIDGDQDGYGSTQFAEPMCLCQPWQYFTALEGGDCDDFNPNIHPGAPEVCDYLDNDCDGLIDPPGTLPHQQPYWPDLDEDGFGDQSADSGLYCPGYQPGWYVDNNLDCDDEDEMVNPGATELCFNGIDDDCDGLIDVADPDCQ